MRAFGLLMLGVQMTLVLQAADRYVKLNGPRTCAVVMASLGSDARVHQDERTLRKRHIEQCGDHRQGNTDLQVVYQQ